MIVATKKVVKVAKNTKPKKVRKKRQEAKCWGAFAKTGFILGLITFATFWLQIISFTTVVPGIVFSSLGLKSKIYHSKAETGLAFSIVGIVLSILATVVFASFSAS